jgi:hypothetical protein
MRLSQFKLLYYLNILKIKKKNIYKPNLIKKGFYYFC